ncbi:hypothetical protein I204_04016 [Kwoniella mangroviensis CBS 8886]|uniref:uncharacterized protein n=1 Tax=Kwoniella mangroviensis CBS 8507 TaxID=1296122 RepID=UPI00080D39AB|nr:uncharacterized protein I203_05576 [Kwoniella mangroviensis CBS 8507]OCF65329.1 hypothetical protein I203_05576 [Kwoniella mangroviensis CBS 8507]OCF75166.1 hypothetical protein I204_04016 [Kwoniella mangroviensis CBS 8886]
MPFSSTSSPTPTPTSSPSRTTRSASDGLVQWVSYTGESTTTIDYIDSNGNFYVASSSSSSSSPLVGSSKSTLSLSSSTHQGGSGTYGQYGPSPTPIGGGASSSSGLASASISSMSGSGNSTEQNSSTSSDTQPQDKGMPLYVIIIISVIVTLGLVGCCSGCWIFKRRRNRRNEQRSRSRISENEIEGDEYKHEGYSPSTMTDSYPPPLSQRDLANVLITSSDRSRSPLTPIPNSATPFIPHSGRRGTRTDSLYTDNSEFDMLAQDGSSYARTLSTYSEVINSEYSERDLGGGGGTGTYSSATPTPLQMNGRSLIRPRLEVDTKSPDGPSSSTSPSNTYTNTNTNNTFSPSYWNTLTSCSSSNSDTHTPLPTIATGTLISPFSDPVVHSHATQPPISPISMTSTTRSWRTEDEVLLMARPSPSARSTGNGSNGLQRGTTIVRYTDGGAALVNPFVRGDEERSPPSYGELYPQDR